MHFFKIYNVLGPTCVNDCELKLCTPYGMLLFVLGSTYVGLIYFKIIKPYFGRTIYKGLMQPFGHFIKSMFKTL